MLGLLAGIAVAPALDQLFKAFGADLPDSGTVLETRTVVVSLLAGTLVTVVAGLRPALRASRVPPIAALREGGSLGAEASGGGRFPLGRVLATLALVAGGSLVAGGVGGVVALVLMVAWWIPVARRSITAAGSRLMRSTTRLVLTRRELARRVRAPRAREHAAPIRAYRGDRPRR